MSPFLALPRKSVARTTSVFAKFSTKDYVDAGALGQPKSAERNFQLVTLGSGNLKMGVMTILCRVVPTCLK
jgi:hypothetical protein